MNDVLIWVRHFISWLDSICLIMQFPIGYCPVYSNPNYSSGYHNSTYRTSQNPFDYLLPSDYITSQVSPQFISEIYPESRYPHRYQQSGSSGSGWFSAVPLSTGDSNHFLTRRNPAEQHLLQQHQVQLHQVQLHQAQQHQVQQQEHRQLLFKRGSRMTSSHNISAKSTDSSSDRSDEDEIKRYKRLTRLRSSSMGPYGERGKSYFDSFYLI